MKTRRSPDRKKLEQLVREQLAALGENPSRPELRKTPARTAQMWEHILSGYDDDPAQALKAFRYEGFDEIVVLKNIRFYSVCEHHLLPFFGSVSLAYIPREGMITGLSSLVRVVEIFSRRLQVQERMTTEIADLMMVSLTPRGALVRVEAEHLCVSMRGESKPGILVKTQALRGIFRKDPRTRAEAQSLLEG